MGKIQVKNRSGVLEMRFGSDNVQGAMRISEPFGLEMEYQRRMMGLALFADAPRQIWALGLGAAGLPKFCWAQTAARITAVEIDPEVVKTAYLWFGLPKDRRLRVVTGDAVGFAARPARSRPGWIFVDMYDAECLAPAGQTGKFLADIAARLAPAGVAAFNLFSGRGDSVAPWLAGLREAFPAVLAMSPEPAGGNVVAFARASGSRAWTVRELLGRARAVEAAYGLEAQLWARDLIAANGLEDGFVF